MKVKDLIEKLKKFNNEDEIIFTLEDTYNDTEVNYSEIIFQEIFEEEKNLINIKFND